MSKDGKFSIASSSQRLEKLKHPLIDFLKIKIWLLLVI